MAGLITRGADLVGKALSLPFIAAGKAITTGLKMGAGAAKFAVTDLGWNAAKGVGTASMYGAGAAGYGFWKFAQAVGKPIAKVFETAENRKFAARSWGNQLNEMGQSMITKNTKGEYQLSPKAILMLGATMTAGKLGESMEEAKSYGIGNIDKRATSSTPNFQPQQYEPNPQKRVSYSDGGATGDLVFALHRLR